MDGYQTEFVVDHEQFVVPVPPELGSVGVLAEPFSVAEKAISEAIQLQLIRLPDSSTSLGWVSGKRCLVAGLGPIGLLAGLALRLRGGICRTLLLRPFACSSLRWFGAALIFATASRETPNDLAISTWVHRPDQAIE